MFLRDYGVKWVNFFRGVLMRFFTNNSDQSEPVNNDVIINNLKNLNLDHRAAKTDFTAALKVIRQFSQEPGYKDLISQGADLQVKASITTVLLTLDKEYLDASTPDEKEFLNGAVARLPAALEKLDTLLNSFKEHDKKPERQSAYDNALAIISKVGQACAMTPSRPLNR